MTIGVVVALNRELAAARDVFGAMERQEEVREKGGGRVYWLAEIERPDGGNHLVAIARSSMMGNTPAAVRVMQLLQHCPRVEHVIMCGIAAGVPHPTKPEHHVRLGDIVVSDRQGVLQYDRTKETPAGEFELPNRWVSPSVELLDIVNDLITECDYFDRRPWEDYCNEAMRRNERWRRPSSESDRLLGPPRGQIASLFERLLGRDPSDGPYVAHPIDPKRREGQPRVFLGPIGSAGIVQRNAIRRDRLRDERGIKAIEMEGAGVADAAVLTNRSFIIVRGTCDYADRGKNDDWQDYAALCAAAFSRAIVAAAAVPVPLPATLTHPDSPTLRAEVAAAVKQLQSVVQQASRELTSIHAEHDAAGRKASSTEPGTAEVRIVDTVASSTKPQVLREALDRTRQSIENSSADETGLLAMVRRIRELLDLGELQRAIEAGKELQAAVDAHPGALQDHTRQVIDTLLQRLEVERLRRIPRRQQ